MLLKSDINLEMHRVSKGFDENLFKYLLPPPFIARLVSFGGSQPGDIVHLKFFLPWPSDWISRITKAWSNDENWGFVDEGEKLPFAMKSWKHIHTVEKTGTATCRIVDDMNFSFGNRLADIVLFPILYLAFLPRKRLYSSYFKNHQTKS